MPPSSFAPCILDPEEPFTMTTLETPIASLPGVSVSLGQLLQTLHAQGRLRPLVVEALAGRLVQQQTRQPGLAVVHHLLFRKDLGGPLAEPLASAGAGELVGPVATAEGFALVVVEERRPAELDGATRQALQDELFDAWLAGRMNQATFD